MSSIFIFLLVIILIFVYYYYKVVQKKKIVEGLSVANDTDDKRAIKYALKQKCLRDGHRFLEGADEFTYDCKYTKDSCLKASVYPTPEGKSPKYYEWRDVSDETALQNSYELSLTNKSTILSSSVGQSSSVEIADQTSPGTCIVANENFRNLCESNGLYYDMSDGLCKTTRKYCNNRLSAYCYNDCYTDATSSFMNTIFGDTIGKAVWESWIGAQATCNSSDTNDARNQS